MMIIEGELEPQKELITTENAENARPPPTRNLLLQQQPGCSDSQVPSFRKIVTKSMASRGHLELPRRFVMDNAAKFGLDVTMRGRSKEAMPVKFVMVYRNDTRDRSLAPRIVVRAASWMPFFKANRLKQGQQVLFSLRAISYFEVEIIADDHDKLMSSSQVPKLEQKRDGHDIHGDDDLDEVQLHTPLVRSITTSAEADQEESATAMRDRAFAQMDLFLAQHALQPMISSTTTATPASCCCSYHHHQHMISSRPPKKKSAHKFEAASSKA
ncbi:unnamed protein product [Sphagnum jensenii]|uniref:TF-B3 domain-containing protein n=1 Tax=Sphagnum jensenii TaxID=128206 RepID=A0ABP1APK5_9BRYO